MLRQEDFYQVWNWLRQKNLYGKNWVAKIEILYVSQSLLKTNVQYYKMLYTQVNDYSIKIHMLVYYLAYMCLGRQ